MRRWSRDKIIGYFIIAFDLVFLVSCAATAVLFFSAPRGPMLGDPEPPPPSRIVILHNAASVPLLVGDDSRYGLLSSRFRLEPGQTQGVEVGYEPRDVEVGYVRVYDAHREEYFCLGAETEDIEPTFYQCLTYSELEAAGWYWELRPDFVEADGSDRADRFFARMRK